MRIDVILAGEIIGINDTIMVIPIAQTVYGTPICCTRKPAGLLVKAGDWAKSPQSERAYVRFDNGAWWLVKREAPSTNPPGLPTPR